MQLAHRLREILHLRQDEVFQGGRVADERVGRSHALHRCVQPGKVFARDLRSDLRSEEHTSELQSQSNLVCRLLLEKKKKFASLRAEPSKGVLSLMFSRAARRYRSIRSNYPRAYFSS